MGLKLIFALVEFGHLDVNEVELVAEDLASLLLGQLHIMEILVALLILIKDKIKNTNGIDSLEPEIPIAPLRLLLNRERGIKEAAILEEFLLGFLEFDDELLAALALAIQIKYSLAVDFRGTQVFGALEGQRLDRLLAPFCSSFRKSISRSLFGSEPKSFLKPKSVKKLMYRSFMPKVPEVICLQLYHLTHPSKIIFSQTSKRP